MDIQLVQQFNACKILVVGDYIIDQYINGDVERISPEAPVPIVRSNWVKTQLGGAGNVVNNIQSLQGHTKVLTCFGKDSYGDLLIELLEKTDADTNFILRTSDIDTIRKIRVTARGQQIVRVDFEKAKPPEISPFIQYVQNNLNDILTGIDVIVISDYGKGIITPELTNLLLTEAKNRSIPVLVDPKGKDWSKYNGATTCTPNLSEFSDVINKKVDQSMEDVILNEGVKICKEHDLEFLLVTRSERGMSLISKNGNKTDFPVKKREVIDVSGAGDTVISTMALCMAAHLPLGACCKIANTAASIAVSKFGTSPVMYDELIDILSENAPSMVVSAANIKRIADTLHSAGKKIVFTNGCFDILHAGHLHSLEYAKSLGDVLIVGLNSDASVKRLKGESRPIICENDRAALLKSLRMVDYVTIFEEDTPLNLIQAIQPDVLVKGEDYKSKEVVGKETVESRGGEVKLVDLKPGLSTSNIIEKILKNYKE